MYKKIIEILKNILIVSKFTKTTKKKRSVLLLGLIGNLLVLSDILIILIFASYFDQNINTDNIYISYLISYKVFLPILVLFRFLLIYLERVAVTRLQFRIEESMRVHLLNEVFIRGNVSVADAYYYVNSLSAQVGSFYSTLSSLFGSLIQIIVFFAYLVFSNFQIILIFSLGSILLFIPTLYLTRLGRKYAHLAYVSGNEISSNLEKVLDNLFLIKIVNQINKEVLNFKKSINLYFTSRLNDIKFGTLNTLLPNFFTLFGLSVLLVFFNFSKLITFDFMGILIRLFQSLGQFNKHFHSVSSFHVYLEKLYDIEKDKEVVNFSNFQINSNLDRNIAIQFKGVSFKYLGSNHNMFNNLNLEIFKGKHTIITGPNGSGKSTLLGLISGVFYANIGNVTSISNKFGYVSASPMIISGTIRENLLYGNEELLEDKILINYLEKFELFEKVTIYDLDRKITNKSLSMGQMQKISFIRALIRNIDILILDESTSNLDTSSKKLIYNILKTENLTIINSTHNPEDILGVDFHLKINIEKENGERTIIYAVD